MADIIKSLVVPYCKYDSSLILKQKRMFVDNFFFYNERCRFSSHQQDDQNAKEEQFKRGLIYSLMDMSLLFTTYSHLLPIIDQLGGDSKTWYSNFKTSLNNLSEDVVNIIHFIFPLMMNHAKHKSTMRMVLIMNELYDSMDLLVQTIMLGEYQYANGMEIKEMRESLLAHRREYMKVILDPVSSPFRTGFVTDLSVKHYFDELDIITDSERFNEIIRDVIHTRKGIDTSRFEGNVEIRELFKNFLNEGSTKDIKGLLVSIVDRYHDDDKDFVLRSNKKWLRSLMKELDDDVADKIKQIAKLLSLPF